MYVLNFVVYIYYLFIKIPLKLFITAVMLFYYYCYYYRVSVPPPQIFSILCCFL